MLFFHTVDNRREVISKFSGLPIVFSFRHANNGPHCWTDTEDVSVMLLKLAMDKLQRKIVVPHVKLIILSRIHLYNICEGKRYKKTPVMMVHQDKFMFHFLHVIAVCCHLKSYSW